MKRIALVIATVLSVLALTSAGVVHDTCLGSFSANMEFSAPSGQPGSMKFDGKLAWANPKLRLDLKDRVTKESMVVLVNFDGGEATLLYPDTLNGFKTKLPAMDSSGYISQFQSLLSSGDVQQGWKKTKVGSDKVAGKSATKYKLSGPKGEQALWWVDSAQHPLRLQTTHGKSKVTLDFGALNFGASVPAKTFTYSKDFSVVEMSGQQLKKQAIPGGQ